MTTTPDFQTETWGQALLRLVKWIGKAAAWVIGIGIAVSLALAGYQQLDENGSIPHERTVDVYMTSDWLVGENRVCSLGETLDSDGKPTGKVMGLTCAAGDRALEPHNLSVTFKGILEPKDMNGMVRSIPEMWKCTRGGDSMTCEATK